MRMIIIVSILQACKFLDEKWSPKVVVIAAQRNHHTKFFQPNAPENVAPGIDLTDDAIRLHKKVIVALIDSYQGGDAGPLIDNKVCHLKNYEFYLYAHAGMVVST